jgi:hypothetical protein
MQLQESDLSTIVGTKEYRGHAVREAISEGRSAYGPITLFVDLETSVMEVEGPFFSTILDLRELQQTEDGVSVKAVRDELDSIVCEQTEEKIIEAYW